MSASSRPPTATWRSFSAPANSAATCIYRLNVYTIKLPPLRERTDDLPLLAAHFLNASARNWARTFQHPRRKPWRS